jgi:manganese/zinc/iron transport system permease protein
MLIIAAIFGGLSGLLGTALSATIPAPASGLSRGWPTGPLITLVATALFLISMLFAPERGIIADLFRRWSLSRRVQNQNLLRAVYEKLEPTGNLSLPWLPSEIDASLTPLHRLQRAGQVSRTTAHSYTLTPAGQDAARHVVRAHRLWELFLIQQADIAPDHVDRDADQIEHVLPPEVLAKLEARLAELGRMPVGTLTSPHPTHPSARKVAQS